MIDASRFKFALPPSLHVWLAEWEIALEETPLAFVLRFSLSLPWPHAFQILSRELFGSEQIYIGMGSKCHRIHSGCNRGRPLILHSVNSSRSDCTGGMSGMNVVRMGGDWVGVGLLLLRMCGTFGVGQRIGIGLTLRRQRRKNQGGC